MAYSTFLTFQILLNEDSAWLTVPFLPFRSCSMRTQHGLRYLSYLSDPAKLGLSMAYSTSLIFQILLNEDSAYGTFLTFQILLNEDSAWLTVPLLSFRSSLIRTHHGLHYLSYLSDPAQLGLSMAYSTCLNFQILLTEDSACLMVPFLTFRSYSRKTQHGLRYLSYLSDPAQWGLNMAYGTSLTFQTVLNEDSTWLTIPFLPFRSCSMRTQHGLRYLSYLSDPAEWGLSVAYSTFLTFQILLNEDLAWLTIPFLPFRSCSMRTQHGLRYLSYLLDPAQWGLSMAYGTFLTFQILLNEDSAWLIVPFLPFRSCSMRTQHGLRYLSYLSDPAQWGLSMAYGTFLTFQILLNEDSAWLTIPFLPFRSCSLRTQHGLQYLSYLSDPAHWGLSMAYGTFLTFQILLIEDSAWLTVPFLPFRSCSMRTQHGLRYLSYLSDPAQWGLSMAYGTSLTFQILLNEDSAWLTVPLLPSRSCSMRTQHGLRYLSYFSDPAQWGLSMAYGTSLTFQILLNEDSAWLTVPLLPRIFASRQMMMRLNLTSWTYQRSLNTSPSESRHHTGRSFFYCLFLVWNYHRSGQTCFSLEVIIPQMVEIFWFPFQSSVLKIEEMLLRPWIAISTCCAKYATPFFLTQIPVLSTQ